MRIEELHPYLLIMSQLCYCYINPHYSLNDRSQIAPYYQKGPSHVSIYDMIVISFPFSPQFIMNPLLQPNPSLQRGRFYIFLKKKGLFFSQIYWILWAIKAAKSLETIKLINLIIYAKAQCKYRTYLYRLQDGCITFMLTGLYMYDKYVI